MIVYKIKHGCWQPNGTWSRHLLNSTIRKDPKTSSSTYAYCIADLELDDVLNSGHTYYLAGAGYPEMV